MTTTQNTAVKEPARSNGSPSPSVKPTDASAAPTSVLPDLSALTDDALAMLVEQGQAEIVRRRQDKENSFLTLVAETARTLGLSPARVAAAIAQKSQRPRATVGADGRHDVKPVYRDPVSGATWSGRGQAPPFIEFGDEVSPKTGKKLPLRKFWIAEQET